MADDLQLLVRGLDPGIVEMTTCLVETIVALRPDLEATVRVGWGSMNFRLRRAGFLCAVFPMKDHVSLVFEHGRQLASPLLQGDGKQVRYIRFDPGATIPDDALGILLAEAIALKA